jgi:hypothetical protein
LADAVSTSTFTVPSAPMGRLRLSTNSSGVQRLPCHHGGLGGMQPQRFHDGCHNASLPFHHAPLP